MPIQSHLALAWPTERAILSFISAAALFVKVSANISLGAAPFSIILAILQVRTLVFPDPAPAIIKEGPSMPLTAASCALFNPSKILFIILQI